MIVTRNEYRNYAQQVDDNLSSLELINIEEFDEFWHEPLFDLCHDNLTDKKIEELSKESGHEIGSDDLDMYIHEYIYECFESIYQTYKVELKGEYNSEHERLEIIWNDEANAYIMPVYCFGISWSMVGVSN